MRILAVISTLSLASAACASQPPSDEQPRTPSSSAASSASSPLATPGAVDAATARRLVAAGVKVVDVRTRAEFDAGHVPGAVNVPYDEIDRRVHEVGSASAPVLLYCRSGRRSAVAARALERKGFTEIYDLQAYDLWVASEPRR